MQKNRIEKDFLGEVRIPTDALYGIQSVRARDNFTLGFAQINPYLINALVTVKKAAALARRDLHPEERAKFDAIVRACDSRDLSPEKINDSITVDALAGGAGTSANMNVNEIIANAAIKILGGEYGNYSIVHPLDDVNRGQSTNDVYPTALRIASILLIRELSASCAALVEALQKRENEFDSIKKLGRTELMDAVPVTLGGEFGSWAQSVARDRWRIYKAEERLRLVNFGGAATGTDIERSPEQRDLHHRFTVRVMEHLRELTGIGLATAEYPMDITRNNDVFVEVSGLLKALSVNLTTISADLRLMNSGPYGGFAEIKLAPLQAGSTIMPGKVNPVIPEAVMQVAMRVQADDLAVTLAASRGEFELNAFLPLIADSILESLLLLRNAQDILRTKCIETLRADEKRCAFLLNNSFAFASSFITTLGYDAVAKVISEKEAEGAAGVRSALEKLCDN